MKKLNSKLFVTATVLALSATPVFASNVEYDVLSQQFSNELTDDKFYRLNRDKKVYRFMVSFKNDNLGMSLVNNDNLRNQNKGQGVSFTYQGKSFQRDVDDYLVEKAFKDEIKYDFGYDFHVNSFFNGIHVVSVAVSDNSSLEDVANNLFKTGYFEYVEEDRFLTLSSQDGDNDGTVGTMSVLNPHVFNDPEYKNQNAWAKQSNSYYGAASIESAIKLMESHGVFASGRKVNVHVIDGGAIDHPDVVYDEVIDIKYTYEFDRGEDGVIWFNNSLASNGYPHYQSCNIRKSLGRGYLRDEPTDEQKKDEKGNDIEWVRYETDGTAIVTDHGLQASSIIGATSNNGIGIAGIIPRENLNLVSVLAVDDCGGYSSYNLMAMYWSVGKLEMPIGYAQFNSELTKPPKYPADVINLSFGSPGLSCSVDGWVTDSGLARFTEEASKNGVVIVASAGNDRINAANESVAGCPYIISVGSIGEYGYPSSFTNFGGDIDVMALGEYVHAASAIKDLKSLKETYYSGASGTSFSGPIVAGLAGLIKLVDPSLTGEEVRSLIKSGARDLSVGIDGGLTSCGVLGCGAGAVNFENTMRILLEGKILNTPVASHYLAQNESREDSSFLAKSKEFNANMCTTYRMDGYLLNDSVANMEYQLYGSNGGDYVLVGTFDKGSFLFNNEYESYKLSACNLDSGLCSEERDVEIDNSYFPTTCL